LKSTTTTTTTTTTTKTKTKLLKLFLEKIIVIVDIFNYKLLNLI
jgi:hypothetical protein